MKVTKSWGKWPLVVVAAAVLMLGGCGGGGGGGEETVVHACTLNDFNKTDLPPEPGVSFFGNNPLYYQQWAIHRDVSFYRENAIVDDANIHLESEHRYLGRNVRVAVIDDGLDTTHEDLANAVVATYDVETGTTDVTPRSDYQNHGTEVTGVIAARNNGLGIVGVAPGVDIYFIRLPFGQNISIGQIVDAFEQAKRWDVDVINCSWGSGDVSDSVAAVIKELADEGRDGKGTVLVFAAGNSDQEIGNDESGLPEVIGVGATDKENLRAYYSNYGPQLDLMAPGGAHIGITTLDQMGNAGLATKDPNYIEYDDFKDYGQGVSIPFAGTSASAPIVTGVVAQLLEANPNLTREDVYNALVCSADKIGNVPYDQDGFNIYYGYGKVNAARALDLVR